MAAVSSVGASPGGEPPSGGGVPRRLDRYHAITAPPISTISASARSGSPKVLVGWPSIGA
jgi:hypothetical protein